MVTLHEVITFLVSMQISISSLQTHNVNRCGRSRHLARKLSLRRKQELTKMQLDNQKEIAEMQNETQKEIAGIQSATSRQNTKDQVYAQNEMLAYQQKESTARVASIMENTNLSKQQQVSE